MKLNRSLILVFLFAVLVPLCAYAQEGPRALSSNRILRIMEHGRVYSMSEFTPDSPLKLEVTGPGRLTVYIKTAVPSQYKRLLAFRLFIKRDNSRINQYLFPATTRSTMTFEGVSNYNPSVEASSIAIDVPGGKHTYEIYPQEKPYIVALASFGYTPEQVAKPAPAPQARPESFGYNPAAHGPDTERTLYLQPYGLVGDVYEQGTNNNSLYAGAGATADLFFNRHIALSGMINYTDAEQAYLEWRNLPLPLGAGMYVVNEQTLLVHALVSYVIMHSRKNIAMAGAGWGDLELINPSFPGEVNGPVIGALVRIGLLDNTSVSFRPSYMQDVSNLSANTNSMLGTPYSLLLYPVGLSFHLSRGVSIEIGYDGRLLTFKDTNRFYNGGFAAAIF